jgi:hypothetical protein
VHARDREGVELLTLQPNDAGYAAGLRTLARQLVQIGAALAQRAGEETQRPNGAV